jgi:hypothetical protein
MGHAFASKEDCRLCRTRRRPDFANGLPEAARESTPILGAIRNGNIKACAGVYFLISFIRAFGSIIPCVWTPLTFL